MKTIKRATVNIVTFFICLTIGSILFAMLRGQILVVRKYYVPAHYENKIEDFEKSGRVETDSSIQPAKICIAGLADLHGTTIGYKQRRIIRKLQEVNPDIIVYLGDMLDRNRVRKSVDSLIVLTKGLIEVAPIYYIDGNHEQDIQKTEPDVYDYLNKEMGELGAVHLDNEQIQMMLEGNGNKRKTVVNICGISTHYYWEDKERAEIEALKKKSGVNVLLCHYPETVNWNHVFEGGGIDIAMCGHTHGGLIVIPFVGGLYAPEQGWWPRYYRGEFPYYPGRVKPSQEIDTNAEYLGTMIISAGLAGEHGVPRINNPKEVTVVDIF